SGRAAAAIVLPHREGPCDRVIRHGLSVGRHGGFVSRGERELFFYTAGYWNGVHLTEPRVRGSRGREEDALAVHAPSDHAIGRRMPRQPFGNAALRRDDEDIDIAIVLAGKRDQAAVG